MLKLQVAAAIVVASQAVGAGVTSAQSLDNLLGYIEAGPTVMKRSRPDSGIVMRNNPGTASYLSGDEFDFGWDAGVDAKVGISFLPNNALELRYLSNSSEADTRFVTPGNFIGAGFTGPSGTAIAAANETDLRNWELNLRHRYSDHLTVLAGLRAIDVKDRLFVNVGPTATGDYHYENDLLGVQIGGEWSVLSSENPFQLSVSGKVGAFSLDSDGGVGLGNPGPVADYRTSVDATSYAAELGISAGYRLTDNVGIRGGYQLLWISDVGLASNNAAMSLTNPSLLRSAIERDDLLYHGFTASLAVSW